jgi:hypothetical protein
MKQAPYKDQIFCHRKTGRRVKVLKEPRPHLINDRIELLYLDLTGPIRHGSKLACAFDRDYEKEDIEVIK